MGGNEIVLLIDARIEESEKVAAGLSVLEPPSIGGHQAIFVEPSPGGNTLRVKIVDITARRFTTMCGGMTQVLGHALLESSIAGQLNIRMDSPTSRVVLRTDAGEVPIIIEHDGSRVHKVMTDMDAFVQECYSVGVREMALAGVRVNQVGRFVVLNDEDVDRHVCNMRSTEHAVARMDLQSRVLDEFDKRALLAHDVVNSALYDLRPACPLHAGRVTFPHRVPVSPIEPVCGTGIVTIGIAMVERGEIEADAGELKLLFEAGDSSGAVGGPELTELLITVSKERVTHASFSHDVVEVLAIGDVLL